MDKLIGTLTAQGSLQGFLSGSSEIIGALSVPETIGYQPFEGEYEVNPTFSSQILETKDKSMSDDVTINAIAVQSVTNPSGGNTIFIGMI